jgi:3-oxoacyl-(acyl-carrier-protein) synthase
MQAAMVDAGIGIDEIDYINPHATSTLQGDLAEGQAIEQLLGPRLPDVPINATKSMTGHSLMASGMIELVASVLQMVRGRLHPTLNLEQADPKLHLRYVGSEAESHTVNTVLSNSFGFGGWNASVIVGSVR